MSKKENVLGLKEFLYRIEDPTLRSIVALTFLLSLTFVCALPPKLDGPYFTVK